MSQTKTDEDSVTIVQTLSLIAGDKLIPVEVVYYLSRYKDNPGFSPVVSPGFNYLGYFETHPLVQKELAKEFTYIQKWDISEPVTYYISIDTPEEYRDVVREGVLYWNKVFGHEVVRVEIAPEGVTAPHFNHNIIQWHSNDEMGLARADMQANPRTGEIHHAQIFISSGWAVTGAEWAEEIDRRISENNAHESLADSVELGEELFQSRLCEITSADLQRDMYLYRDTINALPQERIQSVAKDVLRLVVAHEVGHTLGLRHNFAASTVSELSGEKEDEILKAYFKTGVLPNDFASPVNSVMDYAATSNRIMMGALLANEETGALPYDRYAIQWAYYGDGSGPVFEGHPFCTDHHVGLFTDCNQRDASRHPVDWLAHDVKKRFEAVPLLLSEAYLSAKANRNSMKRGKVEKATPSIRSLVNSIIKSFNDLLVYLTSDIKLLAIEDQYQDRTEVDYDDIGRDTKEWLDYEIAWSGGIGEVLRLINPGYFSMVVKNYSPEFDALIDSGLFEDVPLLEGGGVSLTADEIDYIRGRAAELFPKVADDLAYAITGSLKDSSFRLVDVIEDIEVILARWADYVVTSGSGLDFRFSLETRKRAARLLISGGPLPEWLGAYIPSIAEELQGHLEEGFGKPIEEIDVGDFPRHEQEYVMEELGIYYTLAAKVEGTFPSSPGPGGPEPLGKGDNNQALNWILWYLTPR